MAPKVMLFDEPASALDPEIVKDVLDVMINLAEENKITMLCVTHEMACPRKIADSAIFIHCGEIVELENLEGFPKILNKISIRNFSDKWLINPPAELSAVVQANTDF